MPILDSSERGDPNGLRQSRGDSIQAIDSQIATAQPEITGEPMMLKAMRWVDDPETGQRVRRELPLKVRRWWWKDEAGQLMLDVRYGNRRMELMPKKPTIQVGSMEQLVPVLEQVREAVVAGELDKVIGVAKVRRKRADA